MTLEALPADDSLTFIGNATTLLRLGPFTLLTDPNFLHRGQWTHIGQGVVTRRVTEPAAQLADLPPLDAVVLSHLHGDHFDRIASRDLPRELPIFTTDHAARRLARRGFGQTTAMSTWASEKLTSGTSSLTVTAVPARHAFGLLGRVLPPVMGSVLEFQSSPQAQPIRLYLSGDTLFHQELRQIRERFDPIDIAIVHLGGTKVLRTLVTMDGKQGVDLVQLLAPGHTVPVHYDDYRRFTSPLSDFLGEVDRRDPPTVVRPVRRGETVPLSDLLRGRPLRP